MTGTCVEVASSEKETNASGLPMPLPVRNGSKLLMHAKTQTLEKQAAKQAIQEEATEAIESS